MTNSQETLHIIYLCLGANLGDKESNLIEGLTRLRNFVEILDISPVYETLPVDYTAQPKFLNLVCKGTTRLSPELLLYHVKKIERDMGRIPQKERYRPRPIDIDILFYDDAIIRMDEPDLKIPHEKLHERAFVLKPLSDIAPELNHPLFPNQTIAQLLQDVDTSGVVQIRHKLLSAYRRDVQCEPPAHTIALNRVGLTNLKRVICLTSNGKNHQLPADLEVFVSLPFDQKGTHMSRLGIAVEEVVNDLVSQTSPDVETLCANIAESLLKKLDAARSEVHLRSQFPLHRRTPVSGIRSQEVYTLLGMAYASPNKTVSLIGVEAEGMTACPCAQHLVREQSERRLQEEGFNAEQIKLILDTVPLPTHNQRGRGRLILSSSPNIRAQDLIYLVESAMSSETYEILKRPDEFFIVNRAHQQPKFVEDVVRNMLASTVESYENLPDDTFISALQTNFETIHKHNVTAEYTGTFGLLRSNLNGETVIGISLEEWLKQQLG